MHSRLQIPGIDNRLSLRTHTEGDSCVSRQIQAHQIWEPYETSLLISHLKPGDVFLDIGANIGYYTVLASVIVQDEGLVFAYEPDEENFRLLCDNLRLNHLTNVVPLQAAVSDYNGGASLYLSEDNKGDHRLFDSGDGRTSRPVRVVNAGDQLRPLTRRVDFIKIDVQGAEYHVLEGLRQTIVENRKTLKMMIEVWPYGLRLSGASGRKLLSLLEFFGMALNIIDHYGRRLQPVSPEFLRLWVDETDRDAGNQGFINLLIVPEGEN